jgi:hypothetical protein
MNPDVFITVAFSGSVTLGATTVIAVLLRNARRERQRAELDDEGA